MPPSLRVHFRASVFRRHSLVFAGLCLPFSDTSVSAFRCVGAEHRFARLLSGDSAHGLRSSRSLPLIGFNVLALLSVTIRTIRVAVPFAYPRSADLFGALRFRCWFRCRSPCRSHSGYVCCIAIQVRFHLRCVAVRFNAFTFGCISVRSSGCFALRCVQRRLLCAYPRSPGYVTLLSVVPRHWFQRCTIARFIPDTLSRCALRRFAAFADWTVLCRCLVGWMRWHSGVSFYRCRTLDVSFSYPFPTFAFRAFRAQHGSMPSWLRLLSALRLP
jgi:hypothetical protein